MSNWLVVQTRPRWEKKVSQLLLEKGLAAFCPLQEVRRQWSDRVKRIQQPVFPLFVFVKVAEEDRKAVRIVPGVKNFVVKDRKPVVIREKTMLGIRQFQQKYTLVEVKTGFVEEPVPAGSNGKLFIEELDMYLVGLAPSHFITDSTDNTL